MVNPQFGKFDPRELETALHRVEQEIQRENQEVRSHEEELKQMQADEVAIKEIPHLEEKLRVLKEKEKNIRYEKPKILAKIIVLKKMQVQRHDELTKIQKSHSDALRKSYGTRH